MAHARGRDAATTLARRLWRGLRERQWLLLGVLWALALLLGYVGLWRYALDNGEARGPGDVLYVTLRLFTMESGDIPGPKSWQLELARWLAPAVAAYTAVQALAFLFLQRLRLWSLRFWRGHLIVCGLGRRGGLMVQRLLAQGERVVAIERDDDAPAVRACRALGAIVLVGDAREPRTLQSAGAARARSVVAITGDDGANAEITLQLRSLCAARVHDPLTCQVHLVDSRLCELLRTRELASPEASGLRLEFANIYEMGARAMLAEVPLPTPETSPHIVVVGLGELGQSLVVRAARTWREEQAGGPRLRLTLVDRRAEDRVALLRGRYLYLEQVCELQPAQLELDSAAFQQGAYLRADPRPGAVYICLDDDARALAVALTMQQQLREGTLPIVVRLSSERGLASLLQVPDPGPGPRLHPFVLLERTCAPELLLCGTHELLARAIHADYVRRRVAAGQVETGDRALLPWEQLPESLRQSNRSQADHIISKLRACGCTLGPLTSWDAERFAFASQELELLARLEHERFVRERLALGWRPGPRDPVKKTSPYLIPWEALSEEVRELDRNPVRALPRLLAGAGLQIYRLP